MFIRTLVGYLYGYHPKADTWTWLQRTPGQALAIVSSEKNGWGNLGGMQQLHRVMCRNLKEDTDPTSTDTGGF